MSARCPCTEKSNILPLHPLVFEGKDNLLRKLRTKIWYVFSVSTNHVGMLLISRNFLFQLHLWKSFVKDGHLGGIVGQVQAGLSFLQVNAAICLKYSSILGCLIHPQTSSCPLGMSGFTSSPLLSHLLYFSEHEALNMKKRKKNLESLLFKKSWNILYGWSTVMGGNYNTGHELFHQHPLRCVGFMSFRKVTITPLWGAEVLVPWSGIKPVPLALGVQSLNHWTVREVPMNAIFIWIFPNSWSSGENTINIKSFMFNIKSQPKALLPYL